LIRSKFYCKVSATFYYIIVKIIYTNNFTLINIFWHFFILFTIYLQYIYKYKCFTIFGQLDRPIISFAITNRIRRWSMNQSQLTFYQPIRLTGIVKTDPKWLIPFPLATFLCRLRTSLQFYACVRACVRVYTCVLDRKKLKISYRMMDLDTGFWNFVTT